MIGHQLDRLNVARAVVEREMIVARDAGLPWQFWAGSLAVLDLTIGTILANQSQRGVRAALTILARSQPSTEWGRGALAAVNEILHRGQA